MPYFRSRLHYSIGNIQSQLPIKGQLLGHSFLTSWKEALRCLPSPLSTHVIGVRLTSNLSLLITIYSHFLFTFEFFAYQLNKIVCASAYTVLWILMPNFRADGRQFQLIFLSSTTGAQWHIAHLFVQAQWSIDAMERKVSQMPPALLIGTLRVWMFGGAKMVCTKQTGVIKHHRESKVSESGGRGRKRQEEARRGTKK